MGAQRRYAIEPTARLDRVSLARAGLIDAAIDAVMAHCVEHRHIVAVYAGDGAFVQVTVAEHWDHPRGRYRPATFASGADGRLLVRAEEARFAVQERMYLVHGCESNAALRLRRVADALYAAVGAGLVEVVPPPQVEAFAREALDGVDPRWFADHCQGLRAHLGLPDGPWTDESWNHALRGRQLCGELTPEESGSSWPDSAAGGVARS